MASTNPSAHPRLPDEVTAPAPRRRKRPSNTPKGCRLFRCASVGASQSNVAALLSADERTAQRTKLIAGIMARLALAKQAIDRGRIVIPSSALPTPPRDDHRTWSESVPTASETPKL
jgi:hypothetical protein